MSTQKQQKESHKLCNLLGIHIVLVVNIFIIISFVFGTDTRKLVWLRSVLFFLTSALYLVLLISRELKDTPRSLGVKNNLLKR